VRHGEARILDDPVAVQDKVQVQRTGGAGRRALPPALALDGSQGLQQGVRPERTLANCRGVQKARLGANADRFGFNVTRTDEL
jgi:hypothetical protein